MDKTDQYTFISQQDVRPESQNLYLTTIASLTPRDNELPENSATSDLTDGGGVSPFVLLSTFVIFILIFVGALFIQVIGKSMNFRNMFLSVVLALFAVSIPAVLSTVRQTPHAIIQASPDTAPRNVKILSGQGGIRVVWETTAGTVGALRYASPTLLGKTGVIHISSNGHRTAQHEVVIPSGAPGDVFEFEILSGALWYNNAGQPIRVRNE